MKRTQSSRTTPSLAWIPLFAAAVLSPVRSGELAAQVAGRQATWQEGPPPVVVSVYTHAGISTTPVEVKQPVAATAGLRISIELWTHLGAGAWVAPFVGGRVAALAANEQRICWPENCEGTTDLKMSYMATMEGGLVFGSPGRPYVFGFFGRATPLTPEHSYDPPTNTYAANSPNTWGAGGGFAITLGRLSLQMEGRFRRDRRYLGTMDDSFEFTLGIPLRSG